MTRRIFHHVLWTAVGVSLLTILLMVSVGDFTAEAAPRIGLIGLMVAALSWWIG